MPQEHEVYDDTPFLCQAVCANVSKKEFWEYKADYSMSGGFMDHKEKRIILKSYTQLSFSSFSVHFLAVCEPVWTLDI